MPYEFTTDDFSKFTDDILKAEGDQAILTSLLIDMQSTITNTIAQTTSDKERLQHIEEENDRLRKRNLELFYQVGDEQKRLAGLPHKDIKREDDKPKQTTAQYMSDYFKRLDK